MLGAAVERNDFIWLVGSLCQINRIPFDPQLLLQRFPSPHSVRQLLEAMQTLGFSTGDYVLKAGGLNGVRFPCIGFQKSDPPRPALLVKSDGARLLYFAAGSQTPATVATDQLADRFEPGLILVRHEAAASAAEADGAPAAARFGFCWFAAELLKHKRIWRDVLAASLFIQLIGLTTPLFTQVIIDKVVVHQTGSTLIAIAAGLEIGRASCRERV